MEHIQGEVEDEAENDGHNITESVISVKQQLVIPGGFYDGMYE